MAIRKAKKIVKRNDEIAGVPTTYAQSENEEHSLKRRQLATTRKQQDRQPQGQYRANAVADELKDFKWGHGIRRRQAAGSRRQDGGSLSWVSVAGAICRVPFVLPPGVCLLPPAPAY